MDPGGARVHLINAIPSGVNFLNMVIQAKRLLRFRNALETQNRCLEALPPVK
jgi:hypothetical protein